MKHFEKEIAFHMSLLIICYRELLRQNVMHPVLNVPEELRFRLSTDSEKS